MRVGENRLKRSVTSMPRLSRTAVLLTGFVIGLGLWLLPAFLLHEYEPWDGKGPWYSLALFIGGLLLGLLGPGRPGAAVAGIFAGQLAVLLWRVVAHPATGELWMVGVVFVGGYWLVAAGFGALSGGALRRRLGPDAGDRRVSDRRA
jgi:hypothetical protein